MMTPDNLNMDELTDMRRKAIAASIRTVSADKLKALGEKLFPLASDPWRERFFEFLKENAGATFHHATTNDDIEVIYCNARNKGIWFKAGKGLGLLLPKSLERLKRIVEMR